jgi:hypothetical protein
LLLLVVSCELWYCCVPFIRTNKAQSVFKNCLRPNKKN